MDRDQCVHIIRDTGVIAILRAADTRAGSAAQMLVAVDALWQGGIRAMEVSLTTPGALDLVAAVVARHGPDLLFGAGTVLDPPATEAAIQAGARFVVSPTLSLDVVALCHRHGVVVVPGCFTPTEMQAAWEAGADLIKLFPASVGGPELVKAILAPLPHLPLVPVGSVTVDNACDYIRAGAAAVGVGSSLVDPRLLDAGDMHALAQRAAALIAAVEKGRR